MTVKPVLYLESRETGDEFMVSEARGMELIEKRFAEEILEPRSQRRR